MTHPFLMLCALCLCACTSPSAPPAAVVYALRLKPGQDLNREIQQFVAANGIEAAWVATCVGSLTEYSLRFADQQQGSSGVGRFEILALAGTVSKHGSHLHLALGDPDGRAFGGHLLDGCRVYTTAEILLQAAPDLVFLRENDGSTPWQELQIRRRTGQVPPYLPGSAQ
jgi:hypothetical protein